ncbi:jg12544 [Pararge aegeria aegeria]|uniref:Jg12544 protein n=1 Tax=Pararge aegeria aegeria TaxID=348720 RepID=A0A8S4S8E8_9NEOP|nr:jg12544 [Pararge aegeria aegeria]
MPKNRRQTSDQLDDTETLKSEKTSKTSLNAKSDQNVKIRKESETPIKKVTSRGRRNMERVEMLARPTARRLRSLWDDKCEILPKHRRDKIKSALEEDYFLSPEQTEQYFQALSESSKRWTGPGGMVGRREQAEQSRELRQRQKWLVNFSAQVAYRLCDYIAKGQKEMLVSNRLRSIADVVLERVAEILGEPKPSRSHPGRLARFMVAISDRIAVWIENAVYRADAIEPRESSVDEHMRLDSEKPLIC